VKPVFKGSIASGRPLGCWFCLWMRARDPLRPAQSSGPEKIIRGPSRTRPRYFRLSATSQRFGMHESIEG